MPLVWTGAEFVAEGGSDTEESDSEQPLNDSQQVVAILNAKASLPPPLPMDPKHARATASAVRTCLDAIPEKKRTIAQDYALRTEVVADTVADWIDRQLDDRRTERTIRTALILALNPNHTLPWVCKKARSSCSNIHIAKGMAFHLRCHPFTRSDVQRGYALLRNYCEHREQRNRARLRSRQRTSDSLDAAVVLVVFQGQARHFGAHRYRYVM